MKKILLLLGVSTYLVSCASGAPQEKAEELSQEVEQVAEEVQEIDAEAAELDQEVDQLLEDI